MLFFLGLAMEGCAGRMPLPAGAEGLGPQAVIAHVRAKRSTCEGYSAELRLQYFGNAGRYKGTAQLFARRPDHLRYDIQGPHGGVLFAFATNGERLAALDMGANSMSEGSATPEHFDALLPLAPLGLEASGWVALMFGEIAISDAATLTYDDRAGLFWLRWARGAYDVRLGVDPVSFDARKMCGWVGDAEQWQVALAPRDAHGLPTTMRVTAAASRTDIELRWRDVDVQSALVDGMFELPRPRGVTIRSLGSSQSQ